jgi:hypothetical protein
MDNFWRTRSNVETPSLYTGLHIPHVDLPRGRSSNAKITASCYAYRLDYPFRNMAGHLDRKQSQTLTEPKGLFPFPSENPKLCFPSFLCNIVQDLAKVSSV